MRHAPVNPVVCHAPLRFATIAAVSLAVQVRQNRPYTMFMWGSALRSVVARLLGQKP
jgi:hypothetical protein